MDEAEAWRSYEREGLACRQRVDAEGVARAYFEAARHDRFLRSQREHFSSYLFAIHYLPQLSADELAQQHETYARLYRGETALPPRSVVGSGLGRLRVGFLAPDFLDSAAAWFYAPLILDLPRQSFHISAYSLSAQEDGLTREIRENVDAYHCLEGRDIETAAECIWRDGLDVLVDLGGHTQGGRTLMIVAKKPARTIVEAIGWFDTTGLPAVDYYLTDRTADPAGQEKYFSETLLRLPSQVVFRPDGKLRRARESLLVRTRGKTVTFAAFQNFLKVNASVLSCWRRILRQVPGSHLVLQDTMCVPERIAAMKEKLYEARFPMMRVEVRMASDEWPQELAACDIQLDTFPYPGGGMTAAALYLGVPVVTLAGSHHSARFGASLLRAAGLQEELVAEDEEMYVEKTVALAQDRSRLQNMKQALWEMLPGTMLCDRAAYAREWAAALRWAVRKKGQGDADCEARN